MLGFEKTFGNKSDEPSGPEAKDVAVSPERVVKKWERPDTLPEEEVLAGREIDRVIKLLGGRSNVEFAELKDDGKAVVKSVHDPFTVEARRERAAYLVSRFLGFDFVPPTAVRDVKDGAASFQEFVDAKVGAEVRIMDIPEDERIKLDVFDVLIKNYDRHSGNYLVRNGKVIAIDNELGFEIMESFGDFKIYNRKRFQAKVPGALSDNLRSFRMSSDAHRILQEELEKDIGIGAARAYIKRFDAFVDVMDDQGWVDESKFTELMALKK